MYCLTNCSVFPIKINHTEIAYLSTETPKDNSWGKALGTTMANSACDRLASRLTGLEKMTPSLPWIWNALHKGRDTGLSHSGQKKKKTVLKSRGFHSWEWGKERDIPQCVNLVMEPSRLLKSIHVSAVVPLSQTQNLVKGLGMHMLYHGHRKKMCKGLLITSSFLRSSTPK